jgi:hypothetical protein
LKYFFIAFFYNCKNLFKSRDKKKGKKKKQKQKVKVKKVFAHCPCIEAFITFICDKRGYEDGDVEVDVGLDSGGGFCKICLSVNDVKSDPELGNGEVGAPPSKKQKRYLATGAKGCFVIGLVQEIPETYNNIKMMINELGIESLSWFNVCLDLKAKREALGMQPSSAKYSCCYCFGCAPFDNPEQMTLRTFGDIKKNAADFLALVEEIGFEKAKLRASEFFSVTNYPIFCGADNEFVLDKVDLSELHLMLGIINKIFDSLHKAMKIDGLLGVYDWSHKKNITPLKYHGGSLGQLILE